MLEDSRASARAVSRKEKMAAERKRKREKEERKRKTLEAENDFSLRPSREWSPHTVEVIQTRMPRVISAPILWLAPISYLKFLCWLFLLGFFAEKEFGSVFVLFTGFYLVFSNFGRKRKKDELSPYSVFNENFETMEGSLTTEQIEGEIMRKMY
eukprot:CFRG4246T1